MRVPDKPGEETAQSMQHQSDRRALGVQRVPVERIVDVCVATGVLGATFQGWSVNVSGRGMSVRSTHVPEPQTPVVVRFEEDGAEVIAEGEVTWRNETGSGSEFGVRFTALDSRSVQALKLLCQSSALAAPVLREGAAQPEEHDTEPAPAASPGVKLHIDGLAAPMQGHLRQQADGQLALGSPLEFLRVGRSVEVEDVALGERRGARIEAVNVRVDPESHVPELIVSLGYQSARPPQSARREPSSARPPRIGVQAPPPPASEPASDAAPASSEAPAPLSKVARTETKATELKVAFSRSALEPVAGDVAPRSASPIPMPEAEDRALSAALHADADAADEAYAGDEAYAADEVSMPLDAYETRDDDDEPSSRPSLEIDESGGPSEAERLRQRLEGVLDGLSSAARAAGERCHRVGAAASRGAEWVALRTRDARRRLLDRRAALPLRRTSAAPPPSSRAARPTLRVIAPRLERQAGDRRLPPGALVGAGFVALALLGTWWGRDTPSAEAVAKPAARTAIQAAPAASPSEAPLPEVPPAPSDRPRLLVPPEEEAVDDDEPSGALAQTSRFNPAPLEPAPNAAPRAAAPKAAPAESRALARAVNNESLFGERPAAPRKKAAAAPAQAEFASGRLHLPIIYRLRLDRPAEGLRGERTPTGFDVVIPGRKTLESGSAISRRDRRFAKVSTKNGSDGAHVSFRFRSSVPGYKVRLRKEYIEIFISAD
jgi:hypothetical protein